MPRSHKRPTQGARLVELRKAAGLTQVDLARAIGESQQNIAYWEHADKPPRSDVLAKIADALGVTVDNVLGIEPVVRPRKGPVGRTRQVFEEVSRLPRKQQDRIVELVTAVLEQYKRAS